VTEAVLASDLYAEPLDLHRVREVRSHALHHGFEADRLAVSEVGGGSLQLLVHRLPAAADASERVREGDVISLGEQRLVAVWVALCDRVERGPSLNHQIVKLPGRHRVVSSYGTCANPARICQDLPGRRTHCRIWSAG